MALERSRNRKRKERGRDIKDHLREETLIASNQFPVIESIERIIVIPFVSLVNQRLTRKNQKRHQRRSRIRAEKGKSGLDGIIKQDDEELYHSDCDCLSCILDD